MKLTRREKHILIIAALLSIFFVIVEPTQKTLQGWEFFYLVFVVGPLGIYIATDPEQKEKR